MGFEDGTEANLIYSVSKGNQGGDMSSQGKEDWYCGKVIVLCESICGSCVHILSLVVVHGVQFQEARAVLQM